MTWLEEVFMGPYWYVKYQLVYLALVCIFAACALLYVKWLVKRDAQASLLRQHELQTIKTPGGETLVVLPLRQYDALTKAAERSSANQTNS